MDFQEVVDLDPISAHQYLIRAMYASTSYVRCHLELEDLPPAYHHLHSTLPKLYEGAHDLVARLVGPNPALYFHEQISKDRLATYFQVQQWLDGAEVSSVANATQAILDIVDRLRKDFWNPELTKAGSREFLARLTRQSGNPLSNHLVRMQESLLLAETLIENFQRLQGFEMELRQVRLSEESWAAWQGRVSEAQLSSHGLACLRVMEN